MTTNTHLKTSIDEPQDLMATQLELESQMTQRGLESFLKNVNGSKEYAREDGTAHGKTILKGRLDALTKAIDAWKESAGTGAAGNNNVSYRQVKDVPSDVLAFLTLKTIVSGLSTLRLLQGVAVSLGVAIEDELRLSKLRGAERKVYNRLVEGAKKRSSAHYKHVYAVRVADHHDSWKSWMPSERLHVGSKMIDLCMDTMKLIEVVHQSTGKNKTVKYIKPTEETVAWIAKKNGFLSSLRPQYEPMVVVPKDWTSPHDGGYISSSIVPLAMVKSNSKAYMEELGDIDMPIVYEAVNALQRTAWQINTDVLDVMQQLWNAENAIGGLPAKEDIPFPTKPFDIDTNEVSRKQYRIDKAKVHGMNLALLSRRCGVGTTLTIAERYRPFRKIYMPYQLDFRGRIYAVPQLHPQGTSYQKALLRFANGKPVGPEGWKWLAVHGSNLAGNDKCSFEDRVRWVQDNEEEILAIAENPYDNRGWATSIAGLDIDKPWEFLGFCFEWAGFCKHGEAFVSKIPVALDGSCSGIQHFSAMLRDEVGGNAVNLIPADIPSDVYRLVAEKVIIQAQRDAVDGTEDVLKHTDSGLAYISEGTKTLAKQWLEFGINRKTTKRSVMTLAYGSKEYGFKDQLLEDILNPARVSGKPFPFTQDGYRAASYLAKAIWNAVNIVLVKAGEAMKWLQQAAQVASSENLPVRWTTAVGFPVMQAYPEMEEHRVKTSISGQVVKLTLRLPEDGGALDKRKQTSGIAPNFVHSCDAAHMMLTTVRGTQAGIKSFAMIHDSFGTCAGDIDTLYKVVREAFVEMYETVDVLGEFRESISCILESDEAKAALPPVPECGALDLNSIHDSRYCFA